MPGSCISLRALFFSIAIALPLILLGPERLQAQPEGFKVQPEAGSVFIGRKPAIQVDIARNILPPNTMLVLDGRDVTPASELTANRITFKSPVPVSGGPHTILLMGYYEDATYFQHEWSFTVKHTEKLDEITAGTNLTLSYQDNLKVEPDNAGVPDWVLQGTGPVNLNFRRGTGQYAIEGNLNYQEQEGTGPEANGLDLRSILVSGSWTGKESVNTLRLGDLHIQETGYTAPGLNLRGAQFQLDRERLSVSAYSLNNAPTEGVRDGVKIFDPDESLLGISVRKGSADGRTNILAAYLTGKENPTGTFGYTGQSVEKEGDVLGVSVTRDLKPGKLTGGLETAFSNYDPDTTSSGGKEGDLALRTDWTWYASQKVGLQFGAEHVGADFKSIGAAAAISDQESVFVSSGVYLEKHTLGFGLSYARGNVDDDDTLPRSSRMGLNARDDIVIGSATSLALTALTDLASSSREPAGVTPLDSQTNSFGAALNYRPAKWSLEANISVSDTDDGTNLNQDTGLDEIRVNLGFTPSDRITVNATLPHINRGENKNTGVFTDTLGTSVSLNYIPIKERLFFDIFGQFQETQADDDSVDNWSLTSTASLRYNLARYFPEYASPSLSLGGHYSRAADRVAGSDENTYTISLILQLRSNLSY